MKKYVVAVLTTVLCISFASANEKNTQQGSAYREAKIRDNAYIKTPIPDWASPSSIPDTKLIGPVVTLLSEAYFRAGNSSQYFVHKAYKFNSASVLSEFGQMPIEFAPEYQTLSLHFLRVIRNGEVIDKRDTSSVRFLQRERGLEQGVYNGMVTASILIDDLRVDDVVEVAYTVSGTNPVFGSKYFEAAGWSQQYPTELRRVVLEYPSNRTIHYKFISNNPATPEPKPVQSLHGGMTYLKFEYPRAPATIVDATTPLSFDLAAWIEFSEYDSWNEVATWAASLFAESTPMTGEFAQEVSRLQSEPDTEQRIVKALQYVQNEIRYFSIALGENSHRPAAPNVTLQRRFGDCKDKSLLLVSLLRKLGINANPVLVAAMRRNNLHSLLPSPLAFDHAIVRVQFAGNFYFLDPTRLGQEGHLETMGQELVGAEVLVVNPNTTALVTIPETDAMRNQVTNNLQETMTITDFTKPATLLSHWILSGRDAEYHRQISRRYPEQYAKYMLTELTKRYAGAHRVGEQEFKDSPENNTFEVIDHYTIDNPAEVTGDAWKISYVPTNMSGTLKRPDSIDRNSPLLISNYPLRMKYSFDIKYPQNVNASLEPAQRESANDYFDLQAISTFHGNEAHAETDLWILRGTIGVADMKNYVKDLQEANSLSSGYFTVPERLTKPNAAAAGNQSFGERLRAKLESEIKAYTKVISDGKLTGSDLTRVYYGRALDYSILSQLDAAIADIKEAVKLDSANPDVHRQAGIIYRKHGDYELSLSEFNSALSFGADPSVVYGNRGISYYYLEKYDNALAEFARVIKDPKDNPVKVYAFLWYLRILNHAGKPVPQNLKDIAVKAEGTWPRQAFGLFTGTGTPEKALEIANKLQGDNHDIALCEAYFYIGDYYLLQHDQDRAAEYFKKSRATGVSYLEEYVAAGRELARMGRQ